MDFPGQVVTPTHIHSWSRESFGMQTFRYTQAATIQVEPQSVTWVANYAVYFPISLSYPYAVNRVFWCNGSAGGANVDFGIYTLGGACLFSTGSTAQSGTSVVQYVTPAKPFVLSPGSYYFALSCSGTTNTVYGWSFGGSQDVLRAAGYLQQASALPLPATATFAALSGSIKIIPYCGVTRTTTGY